MPSTSNAIVYPFDPTGVAATNLVQGEVQILTKPSFRDFHFVVPNFGPYFANSLQLSIKDLNGNSRILSPGTDWQPSHKFYRASLQCMSGVYGSISFMDLELAGQLTMSYQSLGGQWVVEQNTIASILMNRLYNPRTAYWEQVTNYPVEFPPIDHQWDVKDMIGMSDVVISIRDLITALATDRLTGFQAHILAKNPHGTEAHDVNAYTQQEVDTKLAKVVSSRRDIDLFLRSQQ